MEWLIMSLFAALIAVLFAAVSSIIVYIVAIGHCAHLYDNLTRHVVLTLTWCLLIIGLAGMMLLSLAEL